MPASREADGQQHESNKHHPRSHGIEPFHRGRSDSSARSLLNFKLCCCVNIAAATHPAQTPIGQHDGGGMHTVSAPENSGFGPWVDQRRHQANTPPRTRPLANAPRNRKRAAADPEIRQRRAREEHGGLETDC